INNGLEKLLSTMDSCGIDKAIACAGGMVTPDELSAFFAGLGHTDRDADNETVRIGCAASGGRLTPFYFANPHRSADCYAAQAPNFRGMELEPIVHGIAFTDERTIAHLRVAQQFKHPVFLAALPSPGCRVDDVTRVAQGFPDVTFVLGHSGVGIIDLHAINLIAPHANIMFETSGGYVCVLAAALARLGASRVVFGSEYPMQHPRIELTKYEVLGLDDDVWRQVSHDNALRILGEPIAS
ncbi:MAG: amidohydrolase family protein, partial [Pseudonocardiaceae bacterium]